MTLSRGVAAPGAAGGRDIDLFDWKACVRVATLADITLSGLQTIDDVSLSAGDRVLVKEQTAGEDNGIYDVAAGAWIRAMDADTDAKVMAGMVVPISEGTVNKNTLWMLTTNNPITLGTTALVFAHAADGSASTVDNILAVQVFS